MRGFTGRSNIVLWLGMLLLSLAANAAETAMASPVDAALSRIEERWARAVYESPERQKNDALAALLVDAREIAAEHPDDPEAVAWHGIIANECVQIRCKTNASRLRREARDALLQAEALGPGALGSLVYGNLGRLYAQSSSRFGGFGSKVRGMGYMWKAIALDPDSLDANYLYAELLVDERSFQEARKILQKASKAQVRPEHERADRGRREQALALLERVESRLGTAS